MDQRVLNTIIGLGVCIAVLPAAGIPHSWEEVLYVIAGMAVAVLGIFANNSLEDIADLLFSSTKDRRKTKREDTHRRFHNRKETHESDQPDSQSDS